MASTAGARSRKGEAEEAAGCKALLEEVRAHGNLPRHVAVIMDGNGRWAGKRGLPRIEGHRAGIKAVRRTVEVAGEIPLEMLTLFTFSTENWNRPAAEVASLMGFLAGTLDSEAEELNRHRVRLRVVGDREGLPSSVLGRLDRTEKMLAANDGLLLTLAINYSGRYDITQAVRQIARRTGAGELRPDEIDEETVAAHLLSSDLPDPDLLIRTSGEMRVSNFMLWQLAYAEIWVTPVLWPDFRKEDLLHGVREYQKRERRFGRVKTTG